MWAKQKSDTRGTGEGVINHVLTTFWHLLWSITVEIHGNLEYICRIWLIYTPSGLTIHYKEEPIKMHVLFILSLHYSYAVVKILSGKSNSYLSLHWNVNLTISRTHADIFALSMGSEAMKYLNQDGELTKLE